MQPSEANRKVALAAGILVPLLHAGRCLLWGSAWPLQTWPINADAFVAGAILIVGAIGMGRGLSWGGALITSGWGFLAGLGYRSLFEQLGDPARHAGHEVLVMVVKALFLLGSVFGMADVVRTSSRDAVLPSARPRS